jgi:hypothetical protein
VVRKDPDATHVSTLTERTLKLALPWVP